MDTLDGLLAKYDTPYGFIHSRYLSKFSIKKKYNRLLIVIKFVLYQQNKKNNIFDIYRD